MATTSRLGLTLIEQGQASAEVIINAGLSSIDAAIAGLALNNAFTGNNTFAGTTKLTGALGGSANPMPWAAATISFATDGDYTLGTTVATEKEARQITINNGVITAQRNLIVPAIASAEWVVTNNNAFSVQVKTAAGTGIVISSNRRCWLSCGGAGNITRNCAETVTTP